MEFKELISEAISALTLNKLRTALASLGIIIGIGSVIALVSVGQGGQKSVESQIQSLGSNLLTVIPGSTSAGALRTAAGSNTTLTYDDAKAIQSSPTITNVAAVSPEVSKREQISAQGQNSNVQVLGVTPAYATVRSLQLQSGTFITQPQVDGEAKVAVLGPQVVSDVFGDTDPTGQSIRIAGQSFRVIGVTVSKGGSGFQNQDDIVFVPLTTAQKLLFGIDYINDISIQAKSAETMTDAQNQVGYLLLARHKMTDPSQADFSILSQADILGAATQVTGIFTTILSGIAAISLLVGGIGIMNIMLVTVTERTREIGLRKSLGATRATVVAQFLTESIILTVVGGTLGMVLGVLLSLLISKLVNLPFVLSPVAVFLAFGVSSAIGVLFGWYPAKKASGLSPIEALRYE